MKPIIVNINEVSDSTELYESRPNRLLVYTIYLILFMLVVTVSWMTLSKMDIVVKSNGIFKGYNDAYEISSGVTGTVKETYVESGMYVDEGDILYVLNIEELSDTIIRYQKELEASTDRLEILSAYEKSLTGGIKELEVCIDNPYYEEFANRRELLYASISLNESDTNGQIVLYEGNIESISGTIEKYKEKINKLNNVKQCIVAHSNTLDAAEGYYYSLVNSYIASYSYTAMQYDNQINEYQKQIEEYEGQVADDLINARDLLEKEKIQALMNLELQQIATIEQQIVGYNDTILSLEMNLASAKLQLNAVNGTDNQTKETVAILTEKGNISAEILSYENKQKECENYLKSYDIQNNNCIVKANISGYFYPKQGLKIGSFVQIGTTIGNIYPEAESKYYAEIYVQNSNIAKIKEGQKVKFEIVAYPSSEYGYFEGTIENIARDISVDQSTGYAYYLVKVSCDNMTLKGEDGEEVTIMNGMACQAKIIVDEKRVLQYLLEKIDLID